MNRIKILLLAAALTLVLAACQSADISMETPDSGSEAGSPSQTVGEVQEPSTQESGEEAVDASEDVSEDATEAVAESEESDEADSSEEVAKFPVRDEKIPPYELDLIDGTSIKLDQFEGQVVIMTFFTTW